MNRDQLDLWCERGILGLVLAILVFGPLATGAVRTPDFLVLQGLIAGVMLLWVLRLWLNTKPQLLWPPLCWAVIGFMGYAIGRGWTADIAYPAQLDVVRTLAYGFLFLAFVNNLSRQEHTTLVVYTLIFLAMAISGYAIYQFVTGSDRVWTFIKPYAHRGTGTFISPNNLAGFLEMILPLGLAWILVSRAPTVHKILVGYASALILGGIAASGSRGGWVSVGLGMIVLFSVLLFYRPYRIPAAAALLCLVVAGVVLLPRVHFIEKRVKQATAHGSVDDARFDLWRASVKLWRENILWGIGPNHFNYRFREYRPVTEQLDPDRVHNDYLNTLTDWGVVGLSLVAAALTLLAMGVRKAWKAARGAPDDFASGKSDKFALVLGASLGLLALLFHSVVDFNMHIPANAILAVTLMALLTGCWRFVTRRYWFSPGAIPRILLSAILMAGVVFLVRQGIRRGTEYRWLEMARRAPNFSNEQIELLKRAFAVEPMNFQTAYAIGEAYRIQSWEGGADYVSLAEQALEWFGRAIRLDRYDSSSWMRSGMCLDWLDRPKDAFAAFDQAMRLDPNGYFNTAHMGWHYVQVGDYAAARVWFERSKRIQSENNGIADSYLKIIQQRMSEAAAKVPGTNDLAH